MFTEVRVNASMEQEFSQTMSGLVEKLVGKKEVTGTSKDLSKKRTYNLMKQLARQIVYQKTDQSMNGETKTELTAKTEFSMRESVYTLIRKKPKKKKKECVKSQVLKQNTRSLHYSNICQMIKNNTTKLIRNKLTLHEKSKKIVKKRTYNRDKSLTGNIESMEKLLSSWKKDFKKKAIVEDLKWSMKSTYKSFTLRNEIMEQHIKPVAIVPPLPLPMWAKALDEPPQTVILRRTPSLNSFFDPRTLRSKVIMRRRMRNGSRKAKPCMIPTESLAKALSSPKWNKGPRQVPVSTFQATRIHYRFLLAKYGKSRLMGRQRVYPNSIKSNVHSNFSVINLLHDVEEAISQNKYSKETDKIVKNFKEELNKDLLYNEPTNRKYNKYQIGDPNNIGTRKKCKLTKQSSGISLRELVEKLGGNDSDESYDIDSDREVKSETCIETGQTKYLSTNQPLMNSLKDSDSNDELFRSFTDELSTNDAPNKLKNNTEDVDVSKVPIQNKKLFKEKKTVKKKKNLIKEPKPENISEEERLSAILQELQKQVKVSEPPTPIFLTKNDSLTELNFEKEPCTYLSMHASSMTTDSDSQSSNLELTTQKESTPAELSEQESMHSLVSPSEPLPIIKKSKPQKSEHSSSKLYTFRIDYECIKNKPMSICNIITALDRVNKLLQNIPIQYDKNTGRPYIVYDPKTIVKVIKEVNVKHEYKMVVKKYNKKGKNDSEADKSMSETNALKTSKKETKVKQEGKGLEEVGNQLLKYILNSMDPPDLNECVSCTNDKDEFNKYSQTFDHENCNSDHSLEDKPETIALTQLTEKTTESLELPDKNIETVRYKKKYFEQVIKISTAYHINGNFHQVIIYNVRQEYFIAQPTASHEAQRNNQESNQNIEEKDTTKLSSNSYTELKEKYMEEFRERKNTPKTYSKHLTNENPNQTQTISQKHYHQYNKTRKLLLTKYELKRNKKKEFVEKVISKPCLKIDLHENVDKNEKCTKNNSFDKHDQSNIINKHGQSNIINKHGQSNIINKHGQSNIINKPENQIIHIPTTQDIGKSHSFDEKRYKTIKNAEFAQCLKGKEVKNKNDFAKEHSRPLFNPLITFNRYSMDQIITNKNDLLINAKNNSEGISGFSLNKSIMNNMLRSVSINTIPNTYPIRKDVTKQVFYFQITYPHIKDLYDIYKKQPSQEFLKSSKHNIFNKFIFYKESSKLKTYKTYINQQIMDSVNTIKNDLNNIINNICQIVNIDNKLLIQFLKICLKQKEFNFEENQKLLLLETEMEELKSLIKKQLSNKINPLRLIQKKQNGPRDKGNQNIVLFDKNLKIKESILRNGINMEKMYSNQVVDNNGLYIETTHPLIEGLNDINKKQPSKEFFPCAQHMFSKLIYNKEKGKLQTYKNYINQQEMDSLNSIKNDLNQNINNISQIVNIDEQILIKFLKICQKQNLLDIKEDEKSLLLEKEMEKLKSLMEENLGKKPNPLRLIQMKQKVYTITEYKSTISFDNDSKLKQSTFKNELNIENGNINQHINNNRLSIEILRFLNFFMFIFSLFSFFN